jgi:hypothetical protein
MNGPSLLAGAFVGMGVVILMYCYQWVTEWVERVTRENRGK